MFRIPHQTVRLPLSTGRLTDPATQRRLEDAQASALCKLLAEGKSVLFEKPVRKLERRLR